MFLGLAFSPWSPFPGNGIPSTRDNSAQNVRWPSSGSTETEPPPLRERPDELDQALRLASTLTWQALAADDATLLSLAEGARLVSPILGASRKVLPTRAEEGDRRCGESLT
jgi:hypothetical protein